MLENNFNGPEDAAVSEIIKQLLHHHKILAETICGDGAALGKARPLSETRRRARKRKKKLKGHRANVGDVTAVRIVCYSWSGGRERTCKVESVACEKY